MTASQSISYFAYGSDMSFRQIRQRLLDAEILLEEECREAASLVGWELRFSKVVPQHPGIGLASIHECAGAVVEGVLYELPAKAIEVLDVCEGVSAGRYSRQTLSVKTSHDMVDAQVYVPAETGCAPGLKPSRNHLYRLLAAEQFLGANYFAALKKTESLKVPVDDDGMPYAPETA